MPRAPTLRQADVERTLRALKAQGLAPVRIEITPGGGLIIIPGPAGAVGSADHAGSATGAQQTPAPVAGLTATPGGVTALDRYRAERAAGRGDRANEGA